MYLQFMFYIREGKSVILLVFTVISQIFEKKKNNIFLQLTAHFWKAWHDFEVKHGNEDTFREMLRIKRSVQAQYNTQVGLLCHLRKVQK